jgi:GTPase SAR1 family protein
MFRTNQLSRDTGNIYHHFSQKFGFQIAKKIITFLARSRTYNIQLVGPKLDKNRCFTERLSRNIFVREDRGYVIRTVVFPTSIGKIAFNIKDSKYDIRQIDDMLHHRVLIDQYAAREWENTDAFFVMFSLTTNGFGLNECARWIQCIRIVEKDIPIILVGVKSDNADNKIQTKDIVAFQMMYNCPYVEISSETLHSPFVELQALLRTSARNLITEIPKIPTTPLL